MSHSSLRSPAQDFHVKFQFPESSPVTISPSVEESRKRPEQEIMASGLVLQETRDYSEIVHCQEHNHQVWGQPLSLAQYKFRDLWNYKTDYLDITKDKRDGSSGGVYFVLKNASGEIESSCEVLIRDAWIKKSGTVKAIKSAVIGSVFTIDKFRGKSNGREMMVQLLELLKTDYLTGTNDVVFLYSEIGEYYSKFGYQSRNVPVYEITVKPQISSNHYRKINSGEMQSIADSLAANVKQKLQTATDLTFALKPTTSIFEYFVNRSKIIHWSLLHPDQDPDNLDISNYGKELVFGFSDASSANFVIVYPQFYTKDCYILTMQYQSEEKRDELIAEALNLCAEYELNQLYAWQSDIGEYKSATINPINGSLPALQSIHQPIESPQWCSNGKWCWY